MAQLILCLRCRHVDPTLIHRTHPQVRLGDMHWSLFYKNSLFIVYVCVPHVCWYKERQKRMSDPLALQESGMWYVGHSTWVPVSELESSGRATSILKCEPSLQHRVICTYIPSTEEAQKRRFLGLDDCPV